MVCKKCGKTLPNGTNFCAFCQQPNMAGTDINVSMDVLEYDELKDMLVPDTTPKDTIDPEQEVRESLKKKKAIIVSLVSIVSAIAIVLIGLQLTGEDKSYGALIKKAEEKYEGGDYVAAYELFEQALTENESGTEALIGAAKVLNESGDYERSEQYIIKALDIEPENEVAYDVLLESVSAVNDPEKILIAEQHAVTEKMKESLSRVVIDPPVFSEPGGMFDDEVIITLSNKNGHQMYYTLDGSDPTSGSGILYEQPITISKEGVTVLKAACFTDGKFGLISEESYDILFKIPPYPEVSPMSGTFNEQTYITITSDAEGARIYYTWDGTTPTTDSLRYTSPIVVIPGNNVLSVIVVDKHDRSSDVMRCNYTYIDENAVEEEEGSTESDGSDSTGKTDAANSTDKSDQDYKPQDAVVEGPDEIPEGYRDTPGKAPVSSYPESSDNRHEDDGPAMAYGS